MKESTMTPKTKSEETAREIGKQIGKNLLNDMDEFLYQFLRTEKGFSELEARQLIKHNELLRQLTDLQSQLEKAREALRQNFTCLVLDNNYSAEMRPRNGHAPIRHWLAWSYTQEAMGEQAFNELLADLLAPTQDNLESQCEICNGSGFVGGNPNHEGAYDGEICMTCNGSGWVLNAKTLDEVK